MVLTGDSIESGVLRSSGFFTCRVDFDAQVTGGNSSASISWNPGVVTFREPDATEAIRSRSGWTTDMVTRFFSSPSTRVPVPASLRGGPWEFGDRKGPFVLEIEFGFTPSDTQQRVTRIWRSRCS
jgi:hypothetical protein